MRYQQYRFKFYLDASHAIFIGGNLGERHPHTWEIAMNMLKVQDGFVEFGLIERKISSFFAQYQGQFINEIAPFDTINPILENCCEYFRKKISDILNAEGWMLLVIEMSETPTRSFVINCMDDEGSAQEQTTESIAESVLSKVRKDLKLDGSQNGPGKEDE